MEIARVCNERFDFNVVFQIELSFWSIAQMTASIAWSPNRICWNGISDDFEQFAADVYARVCRVNYEQPGFCVLNLGREVDTVAFRKTMVALKESLSAIHQVKTGRRLAYLTASRFDQQVSTKPHLDSAPDESILMLGYEPSEVESELSIVDYSQCARDMGLSPKDFLLKHNPMFRSSSEMLQPYTTRVTCFTAREYQIVVINNSSAPNSIEQPAWQGVLHQATIRYPDDARRRIINSTLIAPVSLDTPDSISESALQQFQSSTTVRRGGYDKPNLTDD